MAASMPAPGMVWQRGRRRRMPSRGSTVVGDLDAAAGVVAHGHPPSAAPADRPGLAAARGLPGAGRRRGRCRGRRRWRPARFWLASNCVPGDVAGVGVGDERDPLVAGHGVEGRSLPSVRCVRGGGRRRTRRRSGGCAGCAAPASGAAASRPARLCVRRCGPAAGTAALRRRRLDDGAGRAGAAKVVNRCRDRVLHAGVGVEHHLAGRVVDQPDRQAPSQFAAAGLGRAARRAAGPG